MTALQHIAIQAEAAGVSFQQIEPVHWRATVDGESFDITQEGPATFVSWAAGRSTHWCFAKALKDGAEVIRYQREQHDQAVAARQAYERSLRSLTPDQRADRIAALEDQRETLRYSAPSHYDLIARSGEISRQIADVREFAR